MLLLLFDLGEESYAIHSSQVVEIVPKVNLKKVFHVPDFIAGLFNYRGKVVPVLDLCQLIQGKPCRLGLSTRIIIVEYPERGEMKGHLGLMAEKVTDTLNKPEAEFKKDNSCEKISPYLGEIIMEQKQIIQLIHLESLLPELEQIRLLSGASRDE